MLQHTKSTTRQARPITDWEMPTGGEGLRRLQWSLHRRLMGRSWGMRWVVLSVIIIVIIVIIIARINPT